MRASYHSQTLAKQSSLRGTCTWKRFEYQTKTIFGMGFVGEKQVVSSQISFPILTESDITEGVKKQESTRCQHSHSEFTSLLCLEQVGFKRYTVPFQHSCLCPLLFTNSSANKLILILVPLLA